MWSIFLVMSILLHTVGNFEKKTAWNDVKKSLEYQN